MKAIRETDLLGKKSDSLKRAAQTVETQSTGKAGAGIVKLLKTSDPPASRNVGAGARGRTGTGLTAQGILSPLRLPVPPLRLSREAQGGVNAEARGVRSSMFEV